MQREEVERGEEAARLDWRIVEAERVLERLRRERNFCGKKVRCFDTTHLSAKGAPTTIALFFAVSFGKLD